MRKLVWAVLAVAAIWAGYWAVGAIAVKRGLAAWLAGLRGNGMTAEYTDLSVAGFPNRFDVTLTDPVFADPWAGAGWRAPFVQLMALSYQPQHYIAVWPHQQTLTLAGLDVEVTSQDMRASVVFSPGPSFVLNRTTLVADRLTAAGWSAGTLRFATRRTAADDLAHEVGVDVLDLTVPGAPAQVTRLHLDGTASFDRRLDRFASGALPTRLVLSDLSLEMGDARLTIAGTLTGSAGGFASGDLALVADDWPAVLALLVAAGLVAEPDRKITETALRVLSGDTARLETTLTYNGGVVSLGPIPLGPAPRMAPP